MPGADLSGNKQIVGYNALNPNHNKNVEADSSGGIIVAHIPVFFGNTSGWQGWVISKGTKGYILSPKSLPTYALDISLLSNASFGTSNLSMYNKNNSSNYEFIFEAIPQTNQYHIKTVDGRYLIFTVGSKYVVAGLSTSTPAALSDQIGSFTIQ